ncbi:MAG: Hsp20 family protein [Gammaproteobacteria bacterium]|nr:Hsp20 family protein [Gammaproteobacteria bacterium]
MSEQTEDAEKGGRTIVRERRYGRFVRSLAVGENVDPESIKASYKDGIPEANVPKPTVTSPSARRITVE